MIRHHAACVVLAAVAALSPGCQGGPNEGQGPRQGSAFRSEIERAPQNYRTAMPRNSKVGAWTAEFLEAQRSVVLESVEPVEVPPGIEHLASRITVIPRSASGAHQLGSGCFDVWPPAGYGPTIEAPHVRVAEKERVYVTHYVRGTVAGTWRVNGTRVRYRVDGEREFQDFTNLYTEFVVFDHGAAPQDPAVCGEVSPRFAEP